jgi:hypothetical protein
MQLQQKNIRCVKMRIVTAHLIVYLFFSVFTKASLSMSTRGIAIKDIVIVAAK